MTNSYFMGGISARGFQTRFDDVINKPGYFTYILKGGPGTGKSTLMKKIVQHFSESEIDLYYCSSDIRSLDAVVIHDNKSIIVDGTAPHIFNATFPGISQTLIDLGRYWDRSKLIPKKTEIHRCFKENAAYHRRARSFVTALSHVNDSIYSQAADTCNLGELQTIAEDLVSYLPDEFNVEEGASTPPSSGNPPPTRCLDVGVLPSAHVNESTLGSCTYQQLSAITSEGYYTQEKPDGINVFGLYDPYYTAGSSILEKMKSLLVNKGQHIILSECTLFTVPQIEHIIIPNHHLLISLITPLNTLDYKVSLDCSDFYSSPKQEEISRSFELVTSLAKETATSISTALEIHDELESFYIGALDFEQLDHLTNELILDIETNQ